MSNAVRQDRLKTIAGQENFLDRIGIPSVLFWGFVGLLLFMVGDGVEWGYLSPFLMERGISQTNAAWIISLYGYMVAIAGWLSGSLSDVWGPRRVISLGLVIWLVFEVLFLAVGVPSGNVWLLALFYGLRGLGYPLFAYGFLVWITVAAPKYRMASAMGWFWFAFTGGLPTLGSQVARVFIPHVGEYKTLWISAGLVALGGIILLAGVREPRGRRRLVHDNENPFQALMKSITLAFEKPKTGIACIVRAINTAPQFGFAAFMPLFFTRSIGFTMQDWFQILSAMFLSNIIWNLLFGLIGDRFGWRKTVAICGGFGCTITTLALYYVPLLHHNMAATIAVGALYGATLAGYVPLSALMPSLAPEHRGASLSLLSLGAGLSVGLGPTVVALFLPHFGVAGVMWIFAALYFASGLMALTLRVPNDTMAGA